MCNCSGSGSIIVVGGELRYCMRSSHIPETSWCGTTIVYIMCCMYVIAAHVHVLCVTVCCVYVCIVYYKIM